MKDQKIIKHKSTKEIEKDVGVNYVEFLDKKQFNKESPLQYTNALVVQEIAKEVSEAEGEYYDPKGFTATATTMYFSDYPRYRGYMEAAGWEYRE